MFNLKLNFLINNGNYNTLRKWLYLEQSKLIQIEHAKDKFLALKRIIYSWRKFILDDTLLGMYN